MMRDIDCCGVATLDLWHYGRTMDIGAWVLWTCCPVVVGGALLGGSLVTDYGSV
eukprot:CAMPEP_0118962098 /NCGR_PEP_ID=MMETSP1173-20130426/551_1 /TAXON_ID=1034831 /ORGANISM="Rhizochromulina marina cf, Strain CCMP1243" /LENGTH=53 /DNA_ID=CAMNT_0006910317 /DNA_START=616 /DNA_END=777 /DNA_ORIENTATION=-